MDIFIILVRIFHIFGGMFWLGTVWMTAIFLGPTAEAIGSDAEKFMSYITVKLRYPTFVAIAAGSNVLAGLLLYWRDSAGFQLAWITTPTGLGFTFGALCALTGFIIGFAAVKPTAEKLGKIGTAMHAAGGPPSREQLASFHQVQKQLERQEVIVAAVLGLALLGMATARYLQRIAMATRRFPGRALAQLEADSARSLWLATVTPGRAAARRRVGALWAEGNCTS